MIKGLHGISTTHCNLLTDIRITKNAGFDSLEIYAMKLVRYLDNGGTIDKLKQAIAGHGLTTGCVNAVLEIERYKGEEKQTMLKEATRLTRAAADLDCPTVQILALNGIDHLPDETVMDIMTENVDAIAKIGEQYGVRYQLEFIAFTKFRTLNQALEVIRRIGRKNVGLVIDFWHLHASDSTPEDVAKLDKDLIYGVHFCDGRLPKPGEAWNQEVLRNYLPGEGELDIPAWTAAVKATGYDGMWSPELIGPTYWEYDLQELATLCYDNMTKYIG